MGELTDDQWESLVDTAQAAAARGGMRPTPWRRVLEVVLPLYEHMIYPVLREQRDHARQMVAEVLEERDRARRIAVALESETSRLRDTAREFRIPMPNDHGRYQEVVVQRLVTNADRWAVMDGSGPGRRAWHAGRWLRLGEITPALAFKHRLDEALDLALQVAEIEGACREAEFLAEQDGDL